MDEQVKKDVVLLLDCMDGMDWESPKWHYLLVIGMLMYEIRRELGAMDRLPENRLHTNDEQVLDLAFKEGAIPMKALVICDMIEDFCDPAGRLYSKHIADIEGSVRIHLEEARRMARPIAWIVDSHREGDAEFQVFPAHAVTEFGRRIVQNLKPFPDERYNERVVPKRRFSGFFGTDLDTTLREWDVDTITLVGNCTDICVLYTAVDARARGYQVIVPSASVATFREIEMHDAALEMMSKNLGVIVQ